MIQKMVFAGLVLFSLGVAAQLPQPIVSTSEYWTRLEKAVKQELSAADYDKAGQEAAWAEIKGQVRLGRVRATVDPCLLKIKRWSEQDTCWVLLTEYVKPLTQGYLQKAVEPAPVAEEVPAKETDDVVVDMSDDASRIEFLGS